MNKHRSKTVFVLDSGFGGTTIVKALKELDASVSVYYFSDNAHFPYGAMEIEHLQSRVCSIVGQALERYQFDAVVIACNTASTIVLKRLRKLFTVPFVGVVPPIKTAARISQSKVIGLMATEGTVRRNYIDDLIEKYAKGCEVHRFGCPDLAALAEDKACGREVNPERLRAALPPITTAHYSAMDVVILGCTHFPILRAELELECSPEITWLDPAFPVARHLLNVLKYISPVDEADKERTTQDIYYTSGAEKDLQKIWPFLLSMGFSKIANWP